MKKHAKLTAFLLAGLCLASCTPGGTSDAATTAEDTTATPVDTTVDTTETETEPTDKGTLAIASTYAWVGYPDADFYPVFSMPRYAEPLTYTYDEAGLSIDAEKNTVKALKAGEYTVTAKSESFETQFTVTVQEIDKTAVGANGQQKYNASGYAFQTINRYMQWTSLGVDGKTTLFIGDSFMDTEFWSHFYEESYPDKDALCLGVSSTTTYDWEAWLATDGWLRETKPKNIVMHMGTNNVYDDGDDVEGTVSALQRLFTLMHEAFPDTPIYWFGISQRSYDMPKISAVRKINAQMKSWCDERDYITYIDTPGLLKNNMLRDNVHPLLEYYSVFTDALAKTDIVIEDKN